MELRQDALLDFELAQAASKPMTNPGSDESAKAGLVERTEGLTHWSCQQELVGNTIVSVLSTTEYDDGLQGAKYAYVDICGLIDQILKTLQQSMIAEQASCVPQNGVP